MLNLEKSKITFLILFAGALIVFIGCEKKTEPEKQEAIENQNGANSDSIKTEEINKINDLTGTWNGTFDKRSAVLKITEQNENEFKGKISIAYREAINQDVSGSIDTSSNLVTMIDLLHSRYMGKYNGRLSDDGKNISGTFTINMDGKKFAFNFKKK